MCYLFEWKNFYSWNWIWSRKWIRNLSSIDIINMKTYFVKCKKDTGSLDPKMFRTKNNRLLMQSKCSLVKIKSHDLEKNKKQKDYWVI